MIDNLLLLRDLTDTEKFLFQGEYNSVRKIHHGCPASPVFLAAWAPITTLAGLASASYTLFFAGRSSPPS